MSFGLPLWWSVAGAWIKNSAGTEAGQESCWEPGVEAGASWAGRSQAGAWERAENAYHLGYTDLDSHWVLFLSLRLFLAVRDILDNDAQEDTTVLLTRLLARLFGVSSLRGGSSQAGPATQHCDHPAAAEQPPVKLPERALEDWERAPKLNVGCGFDYRQAYINVDLNAEHGPDLVADATWLEPIEDNSCGEVVAQDVLEHMPRAKSTTALYEWNRVLMPGGKLVLRIPSVTHLVGLMSDPRFQALEDQQRLMQCLYGTQGYVGDFHLNGYTEVTLRHALTDAGFEVESIIIIDEWMFEAVARKVSHKAPDALLRVASDVEFIEQAYRHVLKREADPEGLAYYVKTLQAGIARESVLASLMASPEYTALLLHEKRDI